MSSQRKTKKLSIGSRVMIPDMKGTGDLCPIPGTVTGFTIDRDSMLPMAIIKLENGVRTTVELARVQKLRQQ